MEMDMKIQRQYIGGFHGEDGAIRKHKLIIESKDKDIDGLEFFSETFTKKNGFMDWGKSETHYYLENNKKMFKSIQKMVEFIKSLKK